MKYTLLFCFCLTGFLLHAQPPVQQSLPQQLARWQAEMPEEKLYLHLDKDVYLTGETIWTKAYLLDAALHQASYMSTVVYVELIDAQDSIIFRKALETAEGEGHGSLEIPAKVSSGTYRLRAYTQWMRNFGTDYQTSLQIINPDRKEPLPPARWRTQQEVAVQFLPEGGQLVAGLESKVGIKALDNRGLGLEVSGDILDEDGKSVGSFQTEHKGMGVFSFRPAAGQQYKARIQWEGQEEAYFQPLPNVEKTGFVMAVNSNAMFFEANITASPQLKDSEFILLAQVRGQIVSLVRAKLKDSQYQVAIPNYKVPAGVMQLTLFDPKGRPQCERITFVRGKEALNLAITPNKTRFGNREKVQLDLKVTDQGGKPVQGNFSLSVADIAAYWESPDRNHLLSQIWLSADLQGFVEDPGYYFSGKSEAIDRDLDLLMLTQGWRKYDWKAIQEEAYPQPKHLIEQGLMITGSLKTALGKTPKEALVVLMADNLFNTYETTAKDGQFAFTGLQYSDTSKLIFQGLTPKRKNKFFEITLDTIAFSSPPRYPYFDRSSPQSKKAELAEYVQQMEQQLEADMVREGELIIDAEAVEITGRREEEKVGLVENALYKNPTGSVKGADMNPSFNVFEAIRGQIPSVKVNGSVGNYSVFIRGVNSLNGVSTPLMILDGNIVDISVLETILMGQVDRVDVLSAAAAGGYGSRGSSGVIAVYTKDGYESGGNAEERLGVLKTQLLGFHYPKTFYSPDYAIFEDKHSLPDLRTTLYWNPMVKTDENGVAQLTFYTGDTDGAFQIIMEGFNPSGYLGRQTQQIEVLE